MAYTYTTVTSGRKQDAELRLGSDDQLQAWLNGKRIGEYPDPRTLVRNQNVVPVTLRPGTEADPVQDLQSTRRVEILRALDRAWWRTVNRRDLLNRHKMSLEKYRPISRSSRARARRSGRVTIMKSLEGKCRSTAHGWVIEDSPPASGRRRVPFTQMDIAEKLVNITNDWCFAKPEEVYAVFVMGGAEVKLQLPVGNFTSAWFDIRNGGALIPAEPISGPGQIALGKPPRETGGKIGLC